MEIEGDLDAIRTGEILESSFINLQLTKNEYATVFPKNKFRNLAEADLKTIRTAEKFIEGALEEQVEYDKIFAEDIKNGVLSEESKTLLNSGRARLSPKIKEEIKVLIDNVGTPLASRKQAAMQSIVGDIKELVSKNPQLLGKVNSKYEVETTDHLAQIEEAVLNDPESIPALLEKLAKDAGEQHADFIFSEENMEDEVTNAASLSYMLNGLKSAAEATSDSDLIETSYDTDGFSMTSANKEAAGSASALGAIFNEGNTFDTAEGSKSIADLLVGDTSLKDRERLHDSINRIESFVKGNRINP